MLRYNKTLDDDLDCKGTVGRDYPDVRLIAEQMRWTVMPRPRQIRSNDPETIIPFSFLAHSDMPTSGANQSCSMVPALGCILPEDTRP